MSSTSTALLTDHYELTMLQAALRDGVAGRRSTFTVFTRHLPPGRRYGVVAGTGRLLEAIGDFRFDPEVLAHLADRRIVDSDTLDWLGRYRFQGDIDGYAEGELFFPESPVLVVESTFADAVLLETLVISVLNHDSAIAGAAARMVGAAGGRPCVEFGSRRTHEQAAVAAARAAYLAGFSGTSNLEAGRRHAVPTSGTSAHAFTLLHDSEQDAFRGQVAAFGPGTTLLVDTFDTMEGIRHAVAAAGPELGAVRLDSGDLAQLAREARALLDSLGATGTRILVTSDLDEYAIAALAPAPIDGYGVGTSVVTGSGAPTTGFVYKLVAREDGDGSMRSVAKKSPGKATHGGRPTALRLLEDGVAVEELVLTGAAAEAPPSPDARPLHVPLVRNGQVVAATDVESARRHHAEVVRELPPVARRLSRGEPAIPTTHRAE